MKDENHLKFDEGTKIMKNLILTTAIAAMLSSSVIAEESMFKPDPVEDWKYTLAVNVFTVHLTEGYDDPDTNEYTEWNNDNKFIGLRVNVNENVGYFATYGKNSVFENSVMGGVELSTADNYIEGGVDLGLATGYEKAVSSGRLLFFNPFLRLNYDVNESLTTSVKAGSMNLLAPNVFVEFRFDF